MTTNGASLSAWQTWPSQWALWSDPAALFYAILTLEELRQGWQHWPCRFSSYWTPLYMTNSIAIILGVLVVAAIIGDLVQTGGSNLLFLGKKLFALSSLMNYGR